MSERAPGLLRVSWRSRRLWRRGLPEPWKRQAAHPLTLVGRLAMEAATGAAHAFDPRIKELALFRVAALVGCPW